MHSNFLKFAKIEFLASVALFSYNFLCMVYWSTCGIFSILSISCWKFYADRFQC